jgi:hypothetical protein
MPAIVSPTLELIVRKRGDRAHAITFEHFAWQTSRLALCAARSLRPAPLCRRRGAAGAGSPTFEVASIRPASPQTNDVRAGVRDCRCPGAFRLDVAQGLIGTRLRVKPQQIVGPDWLGQERFDLAANDSAGGSAAQVRRCMRALLADRFGMTVHRETREFPVYALGVAKGGRSFNTESSGSNAETTSEKPPAVNVTASGLASGTTVDLGPGLVVRVWKQSPRGQEDDPGGVCRMLNAIRRIARCSIRQDLRANTMSSSTSLPRTT